MEPNPIFNELIELILKTDHTCRQCQHTAPITQWTNNDVKTDHHDTIEILMNRSCPQCGNHEDHGTLLIPGSLTTNRDTT